VDKEILVKHIQALVSDYSQRSQTFTLVMLIPTDPDVIDSRYTLLVSAYWLDDKSPKDAVNLILTDLINKIGSTNSPEYRKIARVTIVKTSDPFVNTITSAFNVSQSDVTLRNLNINGVLIEHAILLESHKPINTPEASRPDPSKKVGRNDPCTCGSGKKYKKCCG
jgi:nitrate reductase beta subunit